MITKAIQNQDQQSLSLPSLASEINARHNQTIASARTTLVSAREAGELLIEAKAQVDHGQWAKWLSENCPDLSQRTANEYKRVFENWEAIESKLAVTANLTIGSALSSIAKPRTVTPSPALTVEPAGNVATQKTPEPATLVESANETEVPEVIQRVQSALRSHFADDELPSEESHCKVIAAVDQEAWPLIVERARERAAMRDSDPKVQEFRDAAKEENWRHKRRLSDKHLVLSMHALDDLNRIKPNKKRHKAALVHIGRFMDELKGWS